MGNEGIYGRAACQLLSQSARQPVNGRESVSPGTNLMGVRGRLARLGMGSKSSDCAAACRVLPTHGCPMEPHGCPRTTGQPWATMVTHEREQIDGMRRDLTRETRVGPCAPGVD
jgi:hypothetical protein